MRLSWADFKANVAAQGFAVRFIQIGDVYEMRAFDPGGICLMSCRVTEGSAECDEFVADFKPAWAIMPVLPTQTMREVKYLRLQGVRLRAEADESGVCVATIEVPSPGRYIDWGEAWISGDSHPDDRITAIDVEAPVGEGGAWAKMSGYLDDTAPEAGWALPAKPAIAEVEPLGWYGLLPYGTRIKITVQCGGDTFTGRVFYANLGWGKDDTA